VTKTLKICVVFLQRFQENKIQGDYEEPAFKQEAVLSQRGCAMLRVSL